MLKRFFDISTGFRFQRSVWECSVHICSCPCIGWPQQPLTENKIKFKVIFHDSVKEFVFQNIKSPISSKITRTGPFLWNGSSKIQIFTDIWYLFCCRLLRPTYATFLKTGWWNSNSLTSGIYRYLQTKSNLHISICQSHFKRNISMWNTLYMKIKKIKKVLNKSQFYNPESIKRPSLMIKTMEYSGTTMHKYKWKQCGCCQDNFSPCINNLNKESKGVRKKTKQGGL
jgi:hypothetical protein